MANNTELEFNDQPPMDLVRRDIYFFTCKACKKERRQSLKEKNAGEGVCKSCKKLIPGPNQPKLFES